MRIIEGRSRRTGSNRLAMSFHDIEVPDLGEPRVFDELGEIGQARQSGDEGGGRTLQIMLGWRDGGPGRHTLTLADGREFVVATSAKDATVVQAVKGSEVARISADRPVVAAGAAGERMFSFAGAEGQTGAVYTLAVSNAAGAVIGRLQVSYDDHAWRQISVARDVARAAVSVAEEIRTWTASGSASLKVKVAGTRLLLDQPVSADELVVLLAACVDIAIGHRRYDDGMRKL